MNRRDFLKKIGGTGIATLSGIAGVEIVAKEIPKPTLYERFVSKLKLDNTDIETLDDEVKVLVRVYTDRGVIENVLMARMEHRPTGVHWVAREGIKIWCEKPFYLERITVVVDLQVYGVNMIKEVNCPINLPENTKYLGKGDFLNIEFQKDGIFSLS